MARMPANACCKSLVFDLTGGIIFGYLPFAALICNFFGHLQRSRTCKQPKSSWQMNNKQQIIPKNAKETTSSFCKKCKFNHSIAIRDRTRVLQSCLWSYLLQRNLCTFCRFCFIPNSKGQLISKWFLASSISSQKE